jgi:hypothetical protein
VSYRFYFFGCQHGCSGLRPRLYRLLPYLSIYLCSFLRKSIQLSGTGWPLLCWIIGVALRILLIIKPFRFGVVAPYFVLAAFFYALKLFFGAFYEIMHVDAFYFYIYFFALGIDCSVGRERSFLRSYG